MSAEKKEVLPVYINTFHRAMQQRFGKKMYRLALDFGGTCPNRDGSKGVGGCIFCSGAGAGNFAGQGESLAEKLASAKARIRKKIGENCGYIAYFQSFTNTYAPLSVLRARFTEAIEHPEIDAVSIATRPDCLPQEVLDLLAELNRRKPVWVELGLQTANEETAARIHRCYPLSDYDSAVTALHRCGIEVITHLILGLPGETAADMLASVRHTAEVDTDGVKLQLLHVLKNTALAQLYRAGAYEPLTLESYIDLLCLLLPQIPKETVIHRLTGDGDKRELIAPLWSADKKRVLNTINRAFRERDTVQGSQYSPD